MIKDDPVHAAISMARKTTTALTPEEARTQLTKKRQEILKFESLRGDLLSIEHDSKSSLAEKIKVLQQDIKALCAQLTPLPATLPIFDLSCLTWRDERGFPRLVPFAIDSNKVAFGVKATRVRWTGELRTRSYTIPSLPSVLGNLYNDVNATLRGMRKAGKSIEIAAVFGGAIPDNVRDLIQGAKDVFEDLYIIAEVRDWKVTERNAPALRSVKGDPILIGFDGENYRMIAAFDVTSVEQIALGRSKGTKSS